MSIELKEVERDWKTVPHITGTVRRYLASGSQFVASRNLDIWFPPGYAAAAGKCYPVLYMHDGQSIFEPGQTYTNQEWGVDEWMTQLSRDGRVREAIVVGIWNTEQRFREYQPSAPFRDLPGEEIGLRARLDEVYGGGPLGDEYLHFIVEEFKPALDAEFLTLPGREDTFVMGSSMGGLISLYSICEYPQVFGAAACLSTHFPVFLSDIPDVPPILLRYLEQRLPPPGEHRIYFDYGTETVDAWYEPHQLRMDAVMKAAGYTHDHNWVTRKFPGEEHSEIAWRKRLDIPLTFLLAAGGNG